MTSPPARVCVIFGELELATGEGEGKAGEGKAEDAKEEEGKTEEAGGGATDGDGGEISIGSIFVMIVVSPDGGSSGVGVEVAGVEVESEAGGAEVEAESEAGVVDVDGVIVDSVDGVVVAGGGG